MAQATMLAFNFAEERHARLQWLCMRQRIRLQDVPAEQQGQTLAALLGMAAQTDAQPASPFAEEMLVLAGAAPQGMNSFLQAWRQARQAPVRLKAMLTPSNVTWTAESLHAELVREDEAMRMHEKSVHLK